MRYDATIGVTTVSFSQNVHLIEVLRSKGFDNILLNETGNRMSKDELIMILKSCDAAIIGLDVINDDILKHIPSLKAIAKYGVGLDNIDFDSCEKYGVRILHTQGVNKRSVAEMALGNMLSLCRNIYVSSNLNKAGRWVKNGGVELTGKTVCIIEAGNIGRDLIALLKPFRCKILVNDIVDISAYCAEHGLNEASKEQIFMEADIISVHTPLTKLTRDMISEDVFAVMKPSAFVINTARGGIVNEPALKEALLENKIAGAALDAYVCEPPEEKELINLPNLICTPHIGGNSKEAVLQMGYSAIDNIVKYISDGE